MVKKNATIPTKKSRVVNLSTSSMNRHAVQIEVYEGERGMTKDNNLLGKFNLEIDPEAQNDEGSHEIEVTFEIDAN